MKDDKLLISSDTPWESLVGYSRAVKVGNLVKVSGTTAMEGDSIFGKGDIYKQTVLILQKIEKILIEAGSNLSDVIRTRMYVTDIANWEEAGKAHLLFFKSIKPATTMIEVNRLINDGLLIEIEVTALIQDK
ncbi:MAG: RidA family protein [Bacteroidota bacterium]|nr:RidA family protein [Bacteroidota bacterium]